MRVFLNCILKVGVIAFLNIANGAETVKPDSARQGITRPVTTPEVDPEQLRGLTPQDFASMTLQDIRLKSAYIDLFSAGLHHFQEGDDPLTNHRVAALHDLKRRGTAATPMLLELCAENKDSYVEGDIIFGIIQIPSIDPKKYLEYARQAVRERGAILSDYGSYASILATLGSAEDVKLLKQWALQRPYVSSDIRIQLQAAKFLRPEMKEIIGDTDKQPGEQGWVPKAQTSPSGTDAAGPIPDSPWLTGHQLAQWFFWVSVALAVFFVAKFGWSITHKKSR